MNVGTTSNRNRLSSEGTDTTRIVTWIAVTLVVVGAINWGLIGLFSFNLVAALFGSLSPLSRIIYILVGLSGLFLAFVAPRLIRHDEATPTLDR